MTAALVFARLAALQHPWQANWDLFKEEFDKLCLTKPLRHRNDPPYYK